MRGETSAGQSAIHFERLLDGLARSAQHLWTAPDLSTSLQEVVSIIGENLDIDRIQLLQNTYETGWVWPLISSQFEWTREKGINKNDSILFQNIPLFYETDPFYNNLAAGIPCAATGDQFPDDINSILFNSSVSSLLLLPIMIESGAMNESTLWGLLLFEDTSGTHPWHSSEVSILQVAASNIGGAISRMRADEALKESEQRFRTILNSIPAGILIIQADSGLVVSLNQAAQIMIGSRYEAIIGQPIKNLLPGTGFQADSGSDVDSQESGLITAAGDVFPVLRKPAYITIDKTNYIVETFLSIVERKHAERIQKEQRIVAEALRDIANAINQSLNLDDVLGTILAHVDKVVPNDAANIMLIEGDDTRVVACQGYETRGGSERVMAKIRKVYAIPNLRRMVETGEPIVVPDTVKSDEWVDFEYSYWIKSYVSVPICRNSVTIGFLNLNSETPGFYTSAHAERLRSFADQAAIAIENARLYENAQKEIAERTKAEKALQQANNLLEERVNQRILELTLENNQLKDELEKRAQTEQALEKERALLAERVEEWTDGLSMVDAQLVRAARLKGTSSPA